MDYKPKSDIEPNFSIGGIEPRPKMKGELPTLRELVSQSPHSNTSIQLEQLLPSTKQSNSSEFLKERKIKVPLPGCAH